MSDGLRLGILNPVRSFCISVLKTRDESQFKSIRFGGAPVQTQAQTKKGIAFALEAYKNFWKNYFKFKGCTSRKEYWTFVLVNICVNLVLAILSAATGGVLAPLLSAYYLAMIIPSLSICTRRLHDAERSGHWQWLYLTGYGSIAVLVFLCSQSKLVDNKYRR